MRIASLPLKRTRTCCPGESCAAEPAGSSSRHSTVCATASATGSTSRFTGLIQVALPLPPVLTSIWVALRAAVPRDSGTCTTARKGVGAYKVSSGLPATARSPACAMVSRTHPS